MVLKKIKLTEDSKLHKLDMLEWLSKSICDTNSFINYLSSYQYTKIIQLTLSNAINSPTNKQINKPQTILNNGSKTTNIIPHY